MNAEERIEVIREQLGELHCNCKPDCKCSHRAAHTALESLASDNAALLEVARAADDDHGFSEYGGHNREFTSPEEECWVCGALSRLPDHLKSHLS